MVERENTLQDGRFYHGIVTHMSRPLERNYFILDSERGTMSIFRSLSQKQADELIVLSQCLLNVMSEYSVVNNDLQ